MDVNPATLPLAWARLARPDLIVHLCERLTRAKPSDLFKEAVEAGDDDLANVYFSDRSASLLRSLRNHLVLASNDVAAGLDARELQAISGTAFVILSEVFREALRPVRGTNPSWFSRPRNGQNRIIVSPSILKNALEQAASAMVTVARDRDRLRSPFHEWPELVLGDSRHELAGLGAFDLVIASPPYCTRIDYAVATTPELLALGGMSKGAFSTLRKQIIGSVVTEELTELNREGMQSPALCRTLDAIKQHHTKAASTYYARYFTKYFADLTESLLQLASVVCNGHVVLVLQNSFFKEVEIDLGEIVTELFGSVGLTLASTSRHAARPPIAGSNHRFKLYRDYNVSAEDVLVFTVH